MEVAVDDPIGPPYDFPRASTSIELPLPSRFHFTNAPDTNAIINAIIMRKPESTNLTHTGILAQIVFE